MGIICIQRWMIEELKLKGNELLVFAYMDFISSNESSQAILSISYISTFLNIDNTETLAIVENLESKGIIETVNYSATVKGLVFENKKQSSFIIANQQEERQKAVIKLGYVYLMHDRSTDYYKIGFSQDPKYREKTLQSEKPTIDLIWTKEGTMQDEKKLHKIYHKKRYRGEWFNLSVKDIQNIQNG